MAKKSVFYFANLIKNINKEIAITIFATDVLMVFCFFFVIYLVYFIISQVRLMRERDLNKRALTILSPFCKKTIKQKRKL